MNIHKMKLTPLLCVVLSVMLFGCGEGADAKQSGQAIEDQLAEIRSAKLSRVTPEEVSEVFALGSDSTDLQRDILNKELVGSVVEWRLPIYEVELVEGRYKITSQPIPIKSKEAVQLLRAAVFIVPSSVSDHVVMRKVKTNDMITVRGRVREIVLRTVVVIEPALLVNQLTIN